MFAEIKQQVKQCFHKIMMDSNMDNFFLSIETENTSLTEKVANLETEIFKLTQQVIDLEKALEKQKKFHRKYAEDVVATENIRIQDFKEEKRSLVEQNKLVVKENKQLTKNASFYKKAYEELVKEDEPANNSNQTPAVPARMIRSTATSMTSAKYSSQTNSSERSHKSSKVLTQISEKLLVENRKLKGKMESLNVTIKMLKSKNQKLENFRKKIDNKKFKFSQDSDELALLVNSTETKNKTTFTPEILAKLGHFSRY